MKSEWLRKPTSDTSVVFVHGILSSGETCWQHENGSYWPELLNQESDLAGLGIYVFTYQTGIFSGSYNLGDAVDALKEWMKLDDVLSISNSVPQIAFTAAVRFDFANESLIFEKLLIALEREEK